MRVTTLVLSVCCAVAVSGTVTQTDWSGGAGTYGPVTEWGDLFHLEDNVSCLGGICPSPVMTYMDIPAGAGVSVQVVDLDLDGNPDLLTAWGGPTYWLNVDGSGTTWIMHALGSASGDVWDARAADINGDSIPDIAFVDRDGDSIVWWENSDTAPGVYWTMHTVDTVFESPYQAVPADVDGDGDLDLVCSSHNDDGIAWWSNLDGIGNSWQRTDIDTGFGEVNTLEIADVDGDGDLDAVAGSWFLDEVAWWENDGSSPWTRHNITSALNRPEGVQALDMDGDGDVDVVTGSWDGIHYWENTDGSGLSWQPDAIDDDYQARSVYCGDLDSDGDIDVLGTGVGEFGEEGLTLWENRGTGAGWFDHWYDFDDDFFASCIADFDGDGLNDVATASYAGPMLWWRNEGVREGTLESSVLNTGTSPVWGSIDWNAVEPEGSDVVLRVRASSNYVDMGEWSDEIAGPGWISPYLEDGDRYFQYMVCLSGSSEHTPLLEDVTVSWNETGIEGPALDMINFEIFPNPAVGFASIHLRAPYSLAATTRVFDLSGRTVHSNTIEVEGPGTLKIDLPEMMPGIYFAVLETGAETFTDRFVIVR